MQVVDRQREELAERLRDASRSPRPCDAGNAARGRERTTSHAPHARLISPATLLPIQVRSSASVTSPHEFVPRRSGEPSSRAGVRDRWSRSRAQQADSRVSMSSARQRPSLDLYATRLQMNLPASSNDLR